MKLLILYIDFYDSNVNDDYNYYNINEKNINNINEKIIFLKLKMLKFSYWRK